MKKGLFEYLADLTELKTQLTGAEDELSGYSQMMINRYISMSPIYLEDVKIINNYRLSDKAHYLYWLSKLPKKNIFFKYIKSKPDNNETIKKLSKYFEVGTRDCDIISRILPAAKIKEICDEESKLHLHKS